MAQWLLWLWGKIAGFFEAYVKSDRKSSMLPDELSATEAIIEDNATSDPTWCEELFHHQSCEGESCRLRHVLEHLVSEVSVDMNDRKNKIIVSDVEILMAKLTQAIGNTNHLWKCSEFELRGSCTNGLKTSRVDELDFLLKLPGISLREEDGWELLQDTEDFGSDRHVQHVTGFESCFQLINRNRRVTSDVKQQSLERNDETVWYFTRADPADSGSLYLSASSFKSLFESYLNVSRDALHSVSESRCGKEGLSGDSYKSLKFITRSNTLMYFPEHLPLAVYVDVTPCISFSSSNGVQRQLVPSRKFDNWIEVNVDPKEFTDQTARQAIIGIKALRDIADDQKIRVDCYGSRVRYYLFEKTKEGYYQNGCHEHASELITKHQDWVMLRPDCYFKVSSYAIVGTVVRCFRQDTCQPLCSLVLKSLQTFEYINSEGRPLCRHIGLFDSNERVRLYADILKNLKNSHSGLKGLPDILPGNYKRFPRVLAYELKQKLIPVHRVSHPDYKLLQNKSDEVNAVSAKQKPRWVHVQLPNGMQSGPLYIPESAQGIWDVYQVDKSTFVRSFLQQVSEREEDLLQVLRQLRDTDSSLTSELYVAVFTFLDKAATKGTHAYTLGQPVVKPLDDLLGHIAPSGNINDLRDVKTILV